MKLLHYLNEAVATEEGLTRQLQAQLTITPEGSYRTAVEQHLAETRSHAERLHRRIGEIGHENQWVVGLGLAESVAGQWLAMAKAPWDVMRGTSVEERVVKNAKDSAAAEALEIATYTAIEHLARKVEDEETAKLAAEIRADEERMLALINAELPHLVDEAVRVEAVGEPGGVTVRARAAVRRVRRQPADAEPAPASEPAGPGEPWSGYDDQNVRDISAKLADADAATARAVLEYERANKNRKSVTDAAEKRLTA